MTGTYGVRGWLRIGTDSPELLAHLSEWRVGEAVWAVEESKVQAGGLLARVAGIETREAAQAVRGAEIAVAREALPEPQPGSYYWDDLIGLEVRTETGARLGRVKAMFSNGAHDVMEIEGERSRLLPWVPEVIRQVDLAAGRIAVRWDADW